jgi:hypothetical protein
MRRRQEVRPWHTSIYLTSILNAMSLRPPTEDVRGFMAAVAIYYGDIVGYEPELLRQYDEVIQRIDRALGESSGRATTAK